MSINVAIELVEAIIEFLQGDNCNRNENAILRVWHNQLMLETAESANNIWIQFSSNQLKITFLKGKKRINLLPCGLLSFWVPVLNMAYYFFYLIFDFDFTSWSSIHRCCTLLPGSYPVFHSAPATTLHDQLQASVLPAKEKLTQNAGMLKLFFGD